MKTKIKSKRAALKRFKITGTGKLVYYKSGKRHLLAKKSAKTMRNKRGGTVVAKVDHQRIAMMFPGLI